MKILIVTQHFPPERGAVRRLFEFARFFVRQGHEVSVLTAIPNYPDGVVPPKYRGRLFYREVLDGVKVYRSWVLPASNRYPGKRMIGFVTFLFTSLMSVLRIRSDFDLVLASTPPVNTPLVGWLISKLKRSRFVIEIRDLQPESSEDFGNLNRSWFTRLMKKVMHGFYHRADKIVTATDGIAEYVKQLGIPDHKVTAIKSGYGEEFVTADHNGIRQKFGWEEKFLVLYSGTLGWAHSLETVIEAARQLTDQPDVQFVFVGDGEKRSALEGMVRDYGLRNVTFIGAQPLETIPYFLKTSDILVESLREVPITQGTFPAKLFEYMASGRPILFGAKDGEAVRELKAAGGVLAFASDDVQRLRDLIMDVKNGTIDGEALGRKYHTHAQQYHPRERWAREYLTFLDRE